MLSVLLNSRVLKIKGDTENINILVEEYKPFIASCANKACGRFLKYGVDDELSIALMAFVEAIGAYNMLKGSFLSFAQNVIKRRLIDYYRKESKYNSNVLLAEQNFDDSESLEDESYSTIRKAVSNFNEKEENDLKKIEILELRKELFEYGIKFEELVESSPKAQKTKQHCDELIAFILNNNEMIQFLKKKKQIPITEIEKLTKIPRKKIERSRKYIIAVIIIITGDYEHIREYVKVWRGLL